MKILYKNICTPQESQPNYVQIMIKLNRFHIRLLVKKFKECFIFYKDVLELPVRYGDETSDYAEFKTDAIHLALFKHNFMADVVGKNNKPFDTDSQDRTAIILRVDDVDHAFKDIKSKGVEFVTAPADRKDWGCRTAHFYDPDGNLIELNSDLL